MRVERALKGLPLMLAVAVPNCSDSPITLDVCVAARTYWPIPSLHSMSYRLLASSRIGTGC